MKNSSPKLLVADAPRAFPDTIKDTHKKYSLTNLLPYNPYEKLHAKLADGLKEYKMLLVAAKEAILEFSEGHLASFDSLVGENSCQIRATLLLLISKNFPIEGNCLLREVIYAIKKIESLDINLAHKEKEHLGNFLDKAGLLIKLDFREIFLISSYILTKVRVLLPPDPKRMIVRNEMTDTKKVKSISNVSSSFARDLVKNLRALVSTISVEFVQDIAEIMRIPEPVVDMVSNTYCLSHNRFGRLKCLPCFWYTLVLLEYTLSTELPFVIIIKQIASDKEYAEINKTDLYFRVENGRFQGVNPNEFSENEPILVILGSSCRKADEFPNAQDWKKELLSYDPREFILAYAAAHRQYPDESKDVLISKSNCDLYHHYKSKADEWGCSLNNSSLFFLVHVYCDKIKNIKG